MGVEIQYIDNDTDLNKVIDLLAKKERVYIDLEFDKNHFRYGFDLCLMQIYDGENCYLIDPLPAEINIENIFKIIEDDSIEKVSYAFTEDMRLLHHLGSYPRNITDLSVALSLLDIEILSLDNALIRMLGDDIFENKAKVNSQRSNWFDRPLSEEQRKYAAEDVLFLPALYEVIKEKLEEIDRTDWLAEEMDAFEDYDWEDGAVSSYLLTKDKKKLTKREWIRFEKIMHLREDISEKMDRPTYKVINKNIVFDLATNPSLINSWTTIRGVHPKVRTKSVQNAIQNLLKEAEQIIKEENIKENDSALERLPKEEALFIKQRNQRVRLLTDSFFQPVKEWMISRYGTNFTHYFLSNRKVIEYINQSQEMLPYQKSLIAEASRELNLELPSVLTNKTVK